MDSRFCTNQDPDEMRDALRAAAQTVGSLVICRGSNSWMVSAIDLMHAVAVCGCSSSKSMTLFEAESVADPRLIPDAFEKVIREAISMAPKEPVLGIRTDVDEALKGRLAKAKEVLDGAVVDSYAAMMAENDEEMSSSEENVDY